MKAVLIFPFRDDVLKSRGSAFNKVKTVLRGYYDWEAIITVDSGHYPFNRAISRNLGVREAERLGADVVVLCDADSVPEKRPLVDSINDCHNGLVHYPFTEVWNMSEKATKKVGMLSKEALEVRVSWKSGPSQGGIWVCQPSTWWKAGGQDPRLAGWGCEDRAFLAANHTLVGEPIFHKGVLMCLYHQRPPARECWVPTDMSVMERYETFRGHRESIKEIINERPHSVGSLYGEATERGSIIRVL